MHDPEIYSDRLPRFKTIPDMLYIYIKLRTQFSFDTHVVDKEFRDNNLPLGDL